MGRGFEPGYFANGVKTIYFILINTFLQSYKVVMQLS